MGKINVLSFDVANLIAAGEVVDRPASAIKEMMENSIDAGATRMTVETQNGGISYMRVTDNGSGISEEDLPLAIRRHATSKIKNAEDLNRIMTLGFRGEALAAISAVTHVRIMSRTADSDTGHLLEVENGEIKELSEFGCDKGTTIIAERLFANIPARRKFLKRDLTETMAVVATVEKMAMSHPEIAFKLICDGVEKLETDGDGSLLHVIRSIYGKDFSSKLIEISGRDEGIELRGYIGRTDNVKANRNSQNFFINHRFIKSKTMTAALEQAYTSYCPAERFPVCFLFLNISPERVDVNVHPSKLEVKFSEEKPVFDIVYHSVRAALESNVTRPEFDSSVSGMRWSEALGPVNTRQETASGRQIGIRLTPTGGESFTEMSASEYRQLSGLSSRGQTQTGGSTRPEGTPRPIPAESVPVTPQRPVESVLPLLPETSGHSENGKDAAPVPEILPSTDPIEKETPRIVPEYRIAGQIFSTYIIVELEDKVLLVDKHAAHERINFEKLKAHMKEREKHAQMLAVPIEIMMTSSEIHDLETYAKELESIGFSLRFARNTVYAEAYPCELDAKDVPGVLQVMAARIHSGTGTPELTRDIIFEKALYQASCKASVKGGRMYPSEDESWIIDQLMKLPDITFCPHGRPVAMEIKKSRLDRQFERT